MIPRLFPFFTIAIAIGLFFGYINPTYTGVIATLKSQVSNFDRALAAAEEFKQREAQLLAEENAIPADGLARLQSFLPDGVDNVQLILDLNNLATRSGLKISNFAVTQSGDTATAPMNTLTGLPLATNTPTDSITMSVSATGTYASFRSFLAAAEQSLRPLDLVHMTLQDSETGVYTYQMTFRIYWLH
jgi:hypothetical protein